MPARTAQGSRRSPPLGRADGGDAVTRVLRQFRQIFNAVKTHFRHVEKQVGLGGAQVWALSVVRDSPNIGVSELARALSIHQSTASNLVKALVERRFVAAKRDTGDRRTVKLCLLPGGAQVLRRSPMPFAGVLPQALGSLDERSLRRLETDLAVLIARLRAPTRGARIPLADM
jgi:DNA-binding MarR family transcriptional regulator